MSRHLIRVLNRRLDAAFEQMERCWAIYKAERTPDNFVSYLNALRRTRMLSDRIKA